MMGWKEMLGAWFVFSRGERMGMVLLLLLTIGWTFLPQWLERNQQAPDEEEKKAFAEAVAQWQTLSEEQGGQKNSRDSSGKRAAIAEKEILTAVLFPFDPNRLDSAGWGRLGLRKSVIRTILRYRAKGGRFRKPEDLQKIYGLGLAEANRLLPYVQIPAPVADSSHFVQRLSGQPARPAHPPARAALDINEADSAAWEALPGIGPRLAGRILLFRERLGGFWSVEQVGETYGLADSVFARLRPLLTCSPAKLRQLEINRESADQLAKHPYLSRALARLIVRYRELHGPFRQYSDLLQIDALSAGLLEKIKPYLDLTTN